jgi:hypothetical protein
MNLYAYVGGDPLNARDPLGLYDSVGSYFEEVGDFAIGELKGAAENLSFGLYNPCYKNSMQSAGGGFGDGLATAAQVATGVGGIAKGLTKAGSSTLRKQLYEIGQKTLTNKEYRYFASRNADPILRGINIVRKQGWFRASLPSPMGLLTQGLKTGATTGLTPLAANSLGAVAATGYGVGSATYNLSKPSECP